MSTMLIRRSAALVDDEHEWPSLASLAGRKHQQQQSLHDGPQEQAQTETVRSVDNDWEMLVQEGNSCVPNQNHRKEEQQEQPSAVQVQVTVLGNPKQLIHCSSSPGLRHADDGDLVSVDYSVLDDDYTEAQDDISSFGMLSGPGSVISVSSTSSFKDAILSTPSPFSLRQASIISDSLAPVRHATQRTRLRPRIVVKPIQRCTRSTGDLQSLIIPEDAEDIRGETDAMEYYHRKALGWRGRQSGLKMRPDEAKRLQMSMYKKDLQRQASGRS